MAQTKATSRTGETPDAKSARMAKEIPERIAAARQAAEAVYGVVKPASEHKASRRPKARAAE
jgi:hypothetical protein